MAKIGSSKNVIKPNLTQASGRDASKLSEALDTAKQHLIEGLG